METIVTCSKDVGFSENWNRNRHTLDLGWAVELHFHQRLRNFFGQNSDLIPCLCKGGNWYRVLTTYSTHGTYGANCWMPFLICIICIFLLTFKQNVFSWKVGLFSLFLLLQLLFQRFLINLFVLTVRTLALAFSSIVNVTFQLTEREILPIIIIWQCTIILKKSFLTLAFLSFSKNDKS